MLRNRCLTGVRQIGVFSRNGFLTEDPTKKITATYIGRPEVHLTAIQEYPQMEPLPLPINIDPTESTRFSPQRARDINSNALLTHQSSPAINQNIDITVDNTNSGGASGNDPHIDSYDCFGAVSLNSSMQSNVPSPFGGLHKFTHLNMPGGQWSQESKFMSNNLNASHYINLRQEIRQKKGTFFAQNRSLHLASYNNICSWHVVNTTSTIATATNINHRHYGTNDQNDRKGEVETVGIVAVEKNEKTELSRADKLKRAVKEYGSTVIIFHVGISLISLGTCYALISSGIDIIKICEYFGWESKFLASKITANASTFVVAYAIHKVFAPIRISITLGATPFIVRYLRQKGILKPPSTKVSKH